MPHKLASILSIVLISAALAFAPNVASAATTGAGTTKTVKECNAKYAANKAAIQGGGQKKADFVAACRTGTEVIPGGAATTTPAATTPATTAATTTATGKTVKECNAEYAANKAAIQAAGEEKADFIKACRAGTEVIPPVPSTPAGASTTSTTTNPSNS